MFWAWISQVFAVTWLNMRNLKARVGASAATVVGIAGVVLVFIGVLSIASGLRATMARSGAPEDVIVLRSGATGEMMSGLSHEETRIIADAAGVQRGEHGPLASAELFVTVDLPKRSTGTVANVPLRGISAAGFDVRSQLEIVEGRKFELGRNEIIVGTGALQEFAGLEIGSERRWGENTWKVVGTFSTGGTVEESELWCDARVLQPAYRRGNTYQTVHLRLESADAFQNYKDALTTDPRLNVMVEPKAQYYSSQADMLSGMIRVFGGLIGALMGFGAVFGALNTMYTAISARTREIATLRALGFGTSPVVISVLIESLVLAAIGGCLGALLAFFAFNGIHTTTLNWQSFSQVTFAFAVTPPLMVGGFIYALVMGFIGGLLPAIRAARMPVAAALRES